MINKIETNNITRIINSETLNIKDFEQLISKDAEPYLEQIAQKAHALTLKYFGRTMQLYTPMYLSNHCDNSCLYCGFKSQNNIIRTTLSLEQVKSESKIISQKGFQHILILTGSSRSQGSIIVH